MNDIENLFRKLKPVMGEEIDHLWLLYQSDPESKEEVESALKILASDLLSETFEEKNLLLEPPSAELSRGKYQIGTVVYGDRSCGEFGLREDEMTQHIGIFGRTGSGKTNCALHLVKNFLTNGVPFLIFDWKRNYRDILRWPEASNVRVFTVGRTISPLCFNPLIPPTGTEFSTWSKKLIEIIMHAYFLGEGVAFILQKALDAICGQSFSQNSGQQQMPTFRDVLDWLQKYKAKGREAQWIDSALRAVGTLCYGPINNVVNSRKSVSLEELLKMPVVLELDALGSAEKTFLIESVLLWIHHFRLQEGKRETFKHAILIEEAHHILLKRAQSRENVMDVVMREIRELGESVIVIDQHPSLISIPSLGNTHTTIVMNLKHSQDVSAIANAMLLADEDKEHLGRLPVGYAVVRLQSRWPKPFLIKVPQATIDKGSVTDEMLKSKSMADSELFPDILPPQRELGEIRAVRDADKIEKENISEQERMLLADIAIHPFVGVRSHYSLLGGFSCHAGNKAKRALEAKGLIEAKSIATPSGRLKILRLTAKGCQQLESMGIDAKCPTTNESLEHEYWKHKIAEMLQSRGFAVAIEEPCGGGKTVDVVARKDGKTYAYEIETGKSDSLQNIKKCLDAGFDEVISLALTVAVKERIESLINEMLGNEIGKTKVVKLEDFIHERM